MLLGSLDILFHDPLSFLNILATFIATGGLALILCITIHEFSHAYAASFLGDMTAKNLGRLSLNPIRHLDPMGTALLVLVGFGWGKPVPVNPHFIRGDKKRGMTIIASAGPLSNLSIALAFGIPIRLGLIPWHSPFYFIGITDFNPINLILDLIGFVVFFNIMLALFNLLPLFPLDGAKIARGLLPDSMAGQISKIESIGPILLLGLIMVDWLTGLNIIWGVLRPLSDMVALLLTGNTFTN
jgi:Zn-dependent protease